MEQDAKTKLITSEVLREAFRRSINVNEDFLQFYVSLLCLDPFDELENGFDRKFIEFVLNKLKSQNSPQMITLKLQWYFKTNYKTKESFTEENRKELAYKLSDLKNDIMDVKNATEPVEISDIFKKIIYFITLSSGMGSPADNGVYQEAQAALKSILSEKELKDLTTLPTDKKKYEINYFMKLVVGIRIFNRDCGKGGEGIVDLPGLLYRSLEFTRETLRQLLVDLMQKINMLTTALDKSYKINCRENGKRTMTCNLPSDVTEADMEYVKSLLITYRQYEIFLRQLMTIIEDENPINDIFVKLKAVLTRTHEICNVRVAVSCASIFPLFEQLSDIWTLLQNETIYLSYLNMILKNLIYYVDKLDYPEEIIKLLLEDSEMMTDAQRLQRYSDVEINLKNEEAFMTSVSKNLDSLYIECIRCDPWKLVHTDGGLLPGIPNMGIAITTNSLQFIFSEPQAAYAFFEDVSGMFLELCMLLSKRIELIEMFNAKKYMTSIKENKSLRGKSEEKTYSIGVQTEEIKLPCLNYVWNTWELKKKALKLADLKQYATKSTTLPSCEK